MSERRIAVLDTTLRDGDQAPLVSFSLKDKLTIAEALVALRVDIIEAGFPAASQHDFEACQQIASVISAGRQQGRISRTAVLSRCTPSDITRSCEALTGDPHGILHLSLPVSDLHMETKLSFSRGALLAKAIESVRYAREFVSSVEIGAEDATRADRNFLAEYCDAVCEAGATVVNIADTVGEATPETITELISYLRERVPAFASGRAQISVHCHNDLGLAAANTLAGILAGAGQIEVSLAGIGERGGNASLEEMTAIMNNPANTHGGTLSVDHTRLYHANRLVCAILGTGVPPFRPVWGSTAAAHASGIHQHGLSRSKHTYQSGYTLNAGFPPQRIVLSRHSGKAGVLAWLQEQVPAAVSKPENRELALHRILTRCKDSEDAIEPGELLHELTQLGLYRGAYIQATGTLEVTTGSDGSTGNPVTANLHTGDRVIAGSGSTVLEALSAIVASLGGTIPRVLSLSITGSSDRYRVYIETVHPVTHETLLAFERTGKDSAHTLFQCLIDAANTAAALYEQTRIKRHE